jgi:Spy/CpxP family protein refolding chaperone
MKNTIIVIMSLFFIIVSFVDIKAQMLRDMGQNFYRIHEQLDLTDQQKAKLEDLGMQHQEKMVDMRAELDKARIETQRLRRSDKLNRSDIINQTKKMSNIRNKMAEARAHHMMDVYETLTDDQRKIWNDLKMDRPKFKDGRNKRHFDRGYRDRGNRF